MTPQTGKFLIYIGIAIVAAGIFIMFFYNKLNWLGRLPGNIRIEKENFRFYFPLKTMVLLGLLLSLIVNIIKRL